LDTRDPEVCWSSSDQTTPLREIDLATLDEELGHATDVEGWITVERRFEPGDVEPGQADFGRHIVEVFKSLVPFYRFFAWTRENDHLALASELVKAKKTRRRKGSNIWLEDDRVRITGGLFSGQTGVVQGYDGSGKVKVKVGTLTLPVKSGSLKRAD
jgi:transcription antitermination factor NusG